MEKVTYTRPYQHIKQNNILATEQYGFRNNSSTEKASFKLINEALLALNNKLTVGGIFCCLEKAFDSVNHETLLSKCEFYGFRGTTNALLRSYLSDRYQRVIVNNIFSNITTFSEWGKIKHGVPQSSILVPLFSLTLYKWSSEYNSWPIKTSSFADYTSIITANPSPSKFKEDVNNIIDNINDWFRGNSLSIIFIKPTSYNLGLKIVRKVI